MVVTLLVPQPLDVNGLSTKHVDIGNTSTNDCRVSTSTMFRPQVVDVGSLSTKDVDVDSASTKSCRRRQSVDIDSASTKARRRRQAIDLLFSPFSEEVDFSSLARFYVFKAVF